MTHSILDSLTTYGTQILWPLEIGPPVALPSVFIIDPLYSALLLIGAVALSAMRRNRAKGVKVLRALMLVSTLYLGLGVTGNAVVRARAEAHPDFRGLQVHVQPTAFNILFWQVLGVDETAYVTGLTSVLGSCAITEISRHERLAEAPGDTEPPPSVRRLEWFTDGFYSYQDRGDSIAITDLRIGFHPHFVFSFDIARRQAAGVVDIDPVRIALDRPRSELAQDLLKRASRTLTTCTA